MQHLVRRESLDDAVTLVHAPLETGRWDSPWYSTSVVDAALGDTALDHLLVDGPPAGPKAAPEARYPALPHLLDRMTETSSIVLDDALRPGERAVIERWEEQSEFRFTTRGVSCDAAIGRRAVDLSL